MLGKFKNLGLANGFSATTLKSSAVMLGDDERYWVVTLAVMERMLKAGYELAA